MTKAPISLSGAIAAVACIFLLYGCVGIEEFESKVSEAAGLRKEMETARARIAFLRRSIDDLQNQNTDRRLEGEELTQSLTMARRHGQQIETKLSDLRARISSQDLENKITEKKTSNLESSVKEARKKFRVLEETNVSLKKQISRFEDKLRFQEQVKKDLAAQFSAEIKFGSILVSRTGGRVIIGIESSTLFSSGRAAIRKTGKKHLRKISRILLRYTNREIQVQGHTDNDPISERLIERWESNWELSTARATRVLRFLVEVGNIDPKTISAAGLGEFRPIADNSTKAGKKQNRRIDIVLFPPAP